MAGLRAIWTCSVRPLQGFQELAARPATPARAFLAMAAWRVPIAFLDGVLTLLHLRWLLGLLERGQGPLAPLWRELERQAPDLVQALPRIPPLPGAGQVLPLLLLAAPVGILGLWMHHACWDHLSLWLLRGLKARRGLRTTLVAEARAMEAGSLGAALALLGSLPLAGWVLGPVLGLVGIWFWVLRGFSLAAHHGCEPWRGVAATLLHVLLFGLAILLCVALALGLALLMALSMPA